jgi:UDP-N-acetylmuramate dehydrogenase
MRLFSDIRIDIRFNEPLAQYSSFKIGGAADFYAKPSNLTELLYVLKFKEREGLPMHALGSGCNTLFSDKGFKGLVLNMSGFEKDLIEIKGPRARVSSGVAMSRFVNELAKEGLSGLEFLAQLPGTAGGALVMNAGFGMDSRGKAKEISSAVREVSFLTPEGDFERAGGKELGFGYRSSDLKGMLVLEAVFELKPEAPRLIQERIEEAHRYRQAVQDWTHPSAGSVFKNPSKSSYSVGEMVDKLGLKSTQIGGAQVSPRHGNFIINKGDATAGDVLELMDLIKGRIREGFDVEVEPEIRYVG